MKRKSIQFEFKADADERTFEGYASVFGVLDHAGDIVMPGAFTRTIKERAGKIKILWQHREPLGVPVEMREDGRGLFVKGKVSKTQLGDDALELMRDGVVSSMSIGYDVARYEVVRGADRAEVLRSVLEQLGHESLSDPAAIAKLIDQVNKSTGSIWLLQDLDLFEFSPVTFPANEEAVISAVKRFGDDPTVVQVLRKLGWMPVEPTAPEPTAPAEPPTPARETKEGRVISQKNLEKLQQAATLIDEVVAAAAATEPENNDGDAKGSSAGTDFDFAPLEHIVKSIESIAR